MDLIYQDRNLIVTYIQIYLRENFGLSVHKVRPVNGASEYYEVTSSDPIEVTGYLTPQTYSSIALYISQFYPNEEYPVRWKGQELDYSDYDEADRDSLGNLSMDYSQRVDIITSNLDNFIYNTNTITVPERVISYLFNEVTSPWSTADEIMRVKQLVSRNGYTNSEILSNDYLDYSQSFMKTVRDIQTEYLKIHPNKNSKYDFKEIIATGYVDPWTEMIILREET